VSLQTELASEGGRPRSDDPPIASKSCGPRGHNGRRRRHHEGGCGRICLAHGATKSGSPRIWRYVAATVRGICAAVTCASDELRDSFVVFPMGGPHLADGPTLCTGRCSKRSRRAPAHARGLPAHQGVEEEPLPL